jgi:hypothetical protein
MDGKGGDRGHQGSVHALAYANRNIEEVRIEKDGNEVFARR